jgi:hypothetical protein
MRGRRWQNPGRAGAANESETHAGQEQAAAHTDGYEFRLTSAREPSCSCDIEACLPSTLHPTYPYTTLLLASLCSCRHILLRRAPSLLGLLIS